MRIFVTGGTGHTGPYIIPEPIATGHAVTALARVGHGRGDAVRTRCEGALRRSPGPRRAEGSGR
jgi:nucleoside-diphosphate-sugar epimerase